MSNEINTAADSTVTDAALAAQAAARAVKPALTKDEKIAKIEADIKRLQEKLDDVRNDRVSAPKAKKEVYVPQVGERVIATVGRNTATSKARLEVGIVRAIKLGEDLGDGKRSQTQVRVEFGSGFDAQFATLYPAQLQREGDVQEANAEAAFAASAPSLAAEGASTDAPAFVAGATEA